MSSNNCLSSYILIKVTYMRKDVNPEVSKMRLITHTKLTQYILEKTRRIQDHKIQIKRLKFDIKTVEKNCKSKYKKD